MIRDPNCTWWVWRAGGVVVVVALLGGGGGGVQMLPPSELAQMMARAQAKHADVEDPDDGAAEAADDHDHDHDHDEEGDEEEDDDEEEMEEMEEMDDRPGYGSGCTATVVLLDRKTGQLWCTAHRYDSSLWPLLVPSAARQLLHAHPPDTPRTRCAMCPTWRPMLIGCGLVLVI